MKSGYQTANSRRDGARARGAVPALYGALIISGLVFGGIATGWPTNSRAAGAALSVAAFVAILCTWLAKRQPIASTSTAEPPSASPYKGADEVTSHATLARAARNFSEAGLHVKKTSSTRIARPHEARLTAVSETFKARRYSERAHGRALPKIQGAQKAGPQAVQLFTRDEYHALKGDARLLADKLDFECLLDRKLTWNEYNCAKIQKLRWELSTGRNMLWDEYAQYASPDDYTLANEQEFQQE